MVRYELINKKMIMSPTAYRVYRAAALLSLTIYFTIALIVKNGPTPLLKQILFVGVVATAVNLVGMEFFLFRFDDSAAWKQMVWFCVMMFSPLGPALYCFLVYSRSGTLRSIVVNEDLFPAEKRKV